MQGGEPQGRAVARSIFSRRAAILALLTAALWFTAASADARTQVRSASASAATNISLVSGPTVLQKTIRVPWRARLVATTAIDVYDGATGQIPTICTISIDGVDRQQANLAGNYVGNDVHFDFAAGRTIGPGAHNVAVRCQSNSGASFPTYFNRGDLSLLAAKASHPRSLAITTVASHDPTNFATGHMTRVLSAGLHNAWRGDASSLFAIGSLWIEQYADTDRRQQSCVADFGHTITPGGGDVTTDGAGDGVSMPMLSGLAGAFTQPDRTLPGLSVRCQNNVLSAESDSRVNSQYENVLQVRHFRHPKDIAVAFSRFVEGSFAHAGKRLVVPIVEKRLTVKAPWPARLEVNASQDLTLDGSASPDENVECHVTIDGDTAGQSMFIDLRPNGGLLDVDTVGLAGNANVTAGRHHVEVVCLPGDTGGTTPVQTVINAIAVRR